MATCVFGLLGVLAGAASARADNALDVMAACAQRLDPQIDVGFERIAARCPELALALSSSDWADWLPLEWSNPDHNLSAQSLQALSALVASERALRSRAPPAEVARLRPILAQLTANAAERQGWWARLQDWLRHALTKNGSREHGNSFARLFVHMSLSEAVLKVVTFVSLAIVVLLAGVILVNEWRAAGVRMRRARPTAGAVEPDERKRLLSWQDIERAAVAERPRLLLALLAAHLTAAQRLPASAALTVRELTRAAQLADEDQAQLLEVALAAERARYCAHPAPAGALAVVIAHGRELLERLSASAVAPP